MQWILEELGLTQIELTPICADNHRAIHMTNTQNLIWHAKHLQIFVFTFRSITSPIERSITRSDNCWED